MNSIRSMLAEPPEGANRLFEVTLRRPPGMKIGIDVQYVTVLGSNGLVVKAISQGGVVDAHNQSCPPADRIGVGDTLLAPGTSPIGSSRLMQDFLSNDMIQVVVLRADKGDATFDDASVPTGKYSQLERFPDEGAYTSEATTAYTTADAAMFASSDSQWSTNASEAGIVAASTKVSGPASMFAPIGESQNSGSMAIQEQEDDPLNLNYWEHVLARPLGSDPDVCSFENGLPRMGCMHELPPLEAILDGCDADDMVQCLPDFEVEELSMLMSGMRRPPAMDEVIEARKLFAAQKARLTRPNVWVGLPC